MEELETSVRHRLQQATDTELSPDFWSKVEKHARSTRKRRLAGRSIGAAAAAALLFAVGSSLPGSGDPSLPVLGDVAMDPTQPTEVREGLLDSGERWQLSVAGPEAWPHARGEAGEICTRIDYRDDDGQAGNTINCSPPNPELQLPDSLDRLFVIRDYETATTLELELPGRSANAPMQILRTGRFPVTWAIADISQLPDFADVERLVIKDVDGNELWSINGPAS